VSSTFRSGGPSRVADSYGVRCLFAGRLVTYSLYIGAATLATKQFGAVVGNIFGSPWSIALQLVLVALVCARL
jgi:hypothetical protein